MKKQAENESVWDYPRPAICEPFRGSLQVIHRDVVVARTTRGYRTLETSHPPSYYFPADDVDMSLLVENGHRTFCEWKGVAGYYNLALAAHKVQNVAWTYTRPAPSFQAIRHFLSFYASKVDACFVNDEQVSAQEGDFYGGWITANIRGPFKGGPGTGAW